MLLKHPYNRKFGFCLESELAPSQKSYENVKQYEIDRTVIVIFNFIRFGFGSAIRVTSAGRTKQYNSDTKGAATNSKHLILSERPVYATDIQPVNGDIKGLKKFIENNSKILHLMGLRGVGFYQTFIHIDTAPRGKDYVVWSGVGAALPKMKEFTLWSL